MQASEVLNRITKAKRSQAPLVRYLLGQDPITGEKVKWCGSWLHFREWTNSGDTKLMNANFCKKHLLCMGCAVRRAARMNEAYVPKLECVTLQEPDLVPAMVTLTMKNGPDLAERVEAFKRGWRAMLSAKRKGASKSCDRNSTIEWNKVRGSLRAIEVTKGSDGQWHVHAHIFVLLSQYIDYRWLSNEWLRFTGDSYIVDVRKCRNGIKAGLLEVLKYACKFSSMTPEEIYFVHQTFNGMRLIDPQGILRGVREPDIDNDDISGMSGPYRDFLASWCGVEKKYHLKFLTMEETRAHTAANLTMPPRTQD